MSAARDRTYDFGVLLAVHFWVGSNGLSICRESPWRPERLQEIFGSGGRMEWRPWGEAISALCTVVFINQNDNGPVVP